MKKHDTYLYHARIYKYILATREEEFEIKDQDHNPYPYVDEIGCPEYHLDPDYYNGTKWVALEQIAFNRQTEQELLERINAELDKSHNGIARLDKDTFITTGTTYQLKSNLEPHIIKFVVTVEHTAFCDIEPTDIISTIK